MDTFLATVKMLIVLGVVIYLISVSMKFLNRYTTQSTRGLKIIQKIAVTKSSSIGVVQIAQRYYVMSFSETQNQILKELDEVDATLLLTQLQEEPVADIKQDFAQLVKKSADKLAQKRMKK